MRGLLLVEDTDSALLGRCLLLRLLPAPASGNNTLLLLDDLAELILGRAESFKPGSPSRDTAVSLPVSAIFFFSLPVRSFSLQIWKF